jgi:hypothetical protein
MRNILYVGIVFMTLLILDSCTKSNLAILIPDGTYKGQWNQINNGIDYVNGTGLYHRDTTFETEILVRNTGDSVTFVLVALNRRQIFLRNENGEYKFDSKWWGYRFTHLGKNSLTYTHTSTGMTGPNPTEKVEFMGIRQ